MPKIILNGYMGKMGRVIRSLSENDKDCEIVAGIDIAPAGSASPFPSYASIFDCAVGADVIIDFSIADAVSDVVEYAVKTKTPAVICSTGLSQKIIDAITDASKHVAMFRSANMSMGINLIASIIKKISPVLNDSNFDIEIVERHHNQKIDAPSGTAILLYEAANTALDNTMRPVYDRSQLREKRTRNEIGIHAIRGGNIVGDHNVIFAGKDEVIELSHSAGSKDVFAVGALNAAKYLVGKPPGLYTMEDMMEALL